MIHRSFGFDLGKFSQFKNHTDRLRAFVISTFAWTAIIIIGLVSLNYLFTPFSWLFLLSQLCVVSMSVVTLGLVRHKRVTAASSLFTLFTWGLLVTLSIMRPGLNSFVFLTCLLITPMLAGLLLNTRMSVVLTLLNFILGFYMVWVEQQPNFVPMSYVPIARMIAYIGVFGMLPVMVFVSRVVFHEVLAAVQAESIARQASARIENENILLEKQLSHRTAHLEEMIKKHREMAEKLEVALLEATAMSHTRSQIITTISHEFRTPITVINTSLDLLEKYGDRLSEEKRLKHRRRIKEGIYEIVHLLDNVSGMNNIIKQGVTPQPELWQVSQLYKELERGLIYKLDASSRLRFRYPTIDPTTISADRNLILELLSILATNAIKFSDDDELVTVSFSHNEECIWLVVTDRGIGVPKAEQSEIFRLLYRASNAEAYPGLGLGLHIAQKIVEALSGQIDCISHEGRGETQFRITLPIQTVDT